MNPTDWRLYILTAVPIIAAVISVVTLRSTDIDMEKIEQREEKRKNAKKLRNKNSRERGNQRGNPRKLPIFVARYKDH